MTEENFTWFCFGFTTGVFLCHLFWKTLPWILIRKTKRKE